MLQLIVGRAGSGKTERLFSQIRELSQIGKGSILIVPEQASFAAEHRILRHLGAEKAGLVKVFSFTSLCSAIFKNYGGQAIRRLSEIGRLCLLSRALDETKDTLSFYGSSTINAPFLETMLATIGECKNAGITAERLHQVVETLPPHMPREKGRDIALLLETYNTFLQEGVLDPLDVCLEAAARVEREAFFADKQIFIDEFKGFTAPQLELIRCMLLSAEQVSVSLCCDKASPSGEIGPFCDAQKTAQQLMRMAREANVAVAKPYTCEGTRFADPMLQTYEKELFSFSRLTAESSGALQVVLADDGERSAEWVAAEIARLVRGGMRYRDILVAARDVDARAGDLSRALEAQNIPYFLDARRDIRSRPLTAFILSLLDCIESDFSTPAVLRLFKTGLLRFKARAVAALENYSFTWNLKGKDWKRPFHRNPAGFTAATPQDERHLALLEKMRYAVIEPIVYFINHSRELSADAYIAEIYRLLCTLGADRGTERIAAAQRRAGEVLAAEETIRIWEETIGVLEQLAATLRGAQTDHARVRELLRLCLANIDIGLIPQTMDTVTIAGVTRMRPDAPKAVFLLGVNEGIFPSAGSSAGAWTPSELRALCEAGLPLSGDAESLLAEEYASAYRAVSCAAEKLYLCADLKDAEGSALRPSAFIHRALELFPDLQPLYAADIPAEENAFSAATGLHAYALQGDSARGQAILSVLRETPALASGLAAIERVRQQAPFAIADAALAKKLFSNRAGGDLSISPTAADRYFGCPFSYFCERGLRLRKPRRAGLSPLETGSITHYVLEKLLGKGIENLDKEHLPQLVEEAAEEYVAQNLAGVAELSARFSHLLQALKRSMVRLCERLIEEFAQSEMRPLAFEATIGRGEKVEPLSLPIPGGGTLWLNGVIDRVDLIEKNGLSYVRVVDYKSRAKEFNLSRIFSGMQLQLLAYLFTLCKNGMGEYEKFKAAGALYMPANETVQEVARDADEKVLQEAQAQGYRMAGALLADKDIVCAMEKEGRGLYLPVKLKKDGELPASSSLFTAEMFGRLEEEVEGLFAGMAQSLYEGDIPALPLEEKFGLTCEYCDYRGICGHEADDPRRLPPYSSSRQALEYLRGEEEQDALDE